MRTSKTWKTDDGDHLVTLDMQNPGGPITVHPLDCTPEKADQLCRALDQAIDECKSILARDPDPRDLAGEDAAAGDPKATSMSPLEPDEDVS